MRFLDLTAYHWTSTETHLHFANMCLFAYVCGPHSNSFCSLIMIQMTSNYLSNVYDFPKVPREAGCFRSLLINYVACCSHLNIILFSLKLDIRYWMPSIFMLCSSSPYYPKCWDTTWRISDQSIWSMLQKWTGYMPLQQNPFIGGFRHTKPCRLCSADVCTRWSCVAVCVGWQWSHVYVSGWFETRYDCKIIYTKHCKHKFRFTKC